MDEALPSVDLSMGVIQNGYPCRRITTPDYSAKQAPSSESIADPYALPGGGVVQRPKKQKRMVLDPQLKHERREFLRSRISPETDVRKVGGVKKPPLVLKKSCNFLQKGGRLRIPPRPLRFYRSHAARQVHRLARRPPSIVFTAVSKRKKLPRSSMSGNR